MSEVIHADHHDDHDHGPEKGLLRWLYTTNHKDIGTLYLWFSFAMFLLGGVFALVIRAELFEPGLQIVEPDFFNQMTTMHGLIMVFGAVMPATVGLANWMIPLQLGAADLALPRINAMSFWLQPFAALLIFTGVFSGHGADTGWTGYAPYVVSEGAHYGTTMWAAGQIMLVASSTLTGINFLTTMAVMRAPGMGWMQMPLFSWSVLMRRAVSWRVCPVWS